MNLTHYNIRQKHVSFDEISDMIHRDIIAIFIWESGC